MLEILEQSGASWPSVPGAATPWSTHVRPRQRKRLFHFDIGEPDSRYPYMLSLSQHDAEVLLIEQLERMGICHRAAAAPERAAPGRASACGQWSATPRTENEEIRADWLVGCDGAHSTDATCWGYRIAGSTYSTSATDRCASTAAAPCGR